ncbi:MAG: hypothetical protein ACRD5B_06205 [Nitrososphaeraceae archaeon]
MVGFNGIGNGTFFGTGWVSSSKIPSHLGQFFDMQGNKHVE